MRVRECCGSVLRVSLFVACVLYLSLDGAPVYHFSVRELSLNLSWSEGSDEPCV